MPITTYRDLEVYQRSMKALVTIHKLVLTFPEYERFGLTDQVRRASKSIPTNIAEGYGRRKSSKEFKHYLAIALGSANEMAVHLEITRELEYARAATCNTLTDDYVVICKILYRLIENWRTHSPSPIKPVVNQSSSDI
jgi:four helix bundle protein